MELPCYYITYEADALPPSHHGILQDKFAISWFVFVSLQACISSMYPETGHKFDDIYLPPNLVWIKQNCLEFQVEITETFYFESMFVKLYRRK